MLENGQTSDPVQLLLQSIEHKYTGPVLRHWLSLFSTGELPSVSDMDPLHFVPSLPYTAIFKWDEAQGDFCCRLSGEDVANSHGSRPKGRCLADLYDTARADSIRGYWQTAIETKSLLFVLRDCNTGDTIQGSRRIILPLWNNDSGSPEIVSVSYYDFDAGYFDHNRQMPQPEDYRCIYLSHRDLVDAAAI